jgi:hypothetical protein
MWTSVSPWSRVSSFQTVFSQHLSEMGVPHRLELLTVDGMLAMDVGLDNHNIAFECDGPTHYCVNAGIGSVPLSRNNVRDTLLKARGWQVISVPWDEWATLDEKEGKDWIRRSLANVGIDV